MTSSLVGLKSAAPVRAWSCVLVLLLAASSAQAVTMGVTSATASQPGERVNVCVTLASGGQSVAGTQNDLAWDGNCATLTEGSCQVAAPRKQLNSAFPAGSSFTLRAFVLALDNLDPIPDGNLYCCSFISELSSAGSCPIRITNALAADPSGKAVQVSAQSGSIRFTGSGGDSGATGGGPGGPAAGPGGGGVVGGLVEQPGRGAEPQVYGGQEPSTPPTPIVIAPAGEEPAAEEPGEGAGEVEEGAGELPEATASAQVQPTTAAPTAAPTVVAGTPTSKPAPTTKPTAAPTVAAAAQAEKKDEGGGWFGCQMTAGGASAMPQILIAIVGLLALRLGRRRRGQ